MLKMFYSLSHINNSTKQNINTKNIKLIANFNFNDEYEVTRSPAQQKFIVQN